MKKDLYTVFIFENGTRFYFKNKRLHREAGPAIVPYNTKKEYISLNSIDENLYKKVFIKKSKDNDREIILKFSNGLEKKMDSPYIYAYYTAFFLNGSNIAKEDLKEYQILKLATELNTELKTNNPATKKLKI